MSGTYERTALLGLELGDLDLDALRDYIQERAPQLLEDHATEEAARRLGLVGRVGSGLAPTVAGLILFGDSPQLLFPQWGVGAVRVRGRRLTDPIGGQVDLEGNLAKLVHDSLQFVADHTQSIVNQIDPSKTAREYPEAAIREAMVNALVHRELRSQARVQLRVFDDRLEIWSPGPMATTTEAELLSRDGGISVPRNGILASTAHQLGLGEQLGRGLPTIRRLIGHDTGRRAQIIAGKTDVLLVLPSSWQSPTTPDQLS